MTVLTCDRADDGGGVLGVHEDEVAVERDSRGAEGGVIDGEEHTGAGSTDGTCGRMFLS